MYTYVKVGPISIDKIRKKRKLSLNFYLITKNNFMKNIDYHNLNPIQRTLLLAAQEVLGRAYNPYSNFAVASALLLEDGKTIVTGVNVENAAYSPVNCAERTAIFKAVADGHQKFLAIAIIAKPPNGSTKKVTAPCGVCRQVIFEFSQISNTDIEIIMATTDMKTITISTINELFPLGFGPKDLK